MVKNILKLMICGVVAFSACSSAPKKSASSPLDQHWQAKTKTITSKKFSKPGKWAAGQYVVNGSINNGERESVSRMTVVRKEGSGWVYEIINTDKKGKTTGMQMLLEGYDKAIQTADASQMSVGWIKMLQENGKVDKVDGQALMFYNAMLKQSWEKLIVATNDIKSSGAITVPAGIFAGTSSITSTVKVLFTTSTATSWLHPDVPVNGVLKTETEDKKSVTELLDFGFNGKPVIE